MFRFSNPALILFALLTSVICLNAQISLKLSAESGLYSSNNGINEDEIMMESRVDGRIKYSIRNDNSLAEFDFRIRPEFYGLDNSLLALKLKGSGAYYRSNEYFDWGVAANWDKQNYNSDKIDIEYDNFALSANISFQAGYNFVSNTSIGYSNRSSISSSDLSINILFVETTILHSIKQRLLGGIGFYFEKFQSDFSIPFAVERYERSDPGYRYGPGLVIDYSELFVFRGSYHFLLHNSELTTDDSYEHQLNIILGYKLNKKLSLLALAEYYKSVFKFKNDYFANVAFYFPSNIENQVSLKAIYDARDETELYLKAGYFNINLKQLSGSLSGWNLLAGIQFSY